MKIRTSRIRSDGLSITLREGGNAPVIAAAIREHGEALHAADGRLLKLDTKTAISVVAGTGPERLCVKHYRQVSLAYGLKRALLRSRAAGSFRVSLALEEAGIATPRALAFAERRSGGIVREAFFITAYAPDALEMDRYVTSRLPRAAQGRFAEAFASFVASLGRAGFFHSDLKSCNILVSDARPGWSFSIIDLDAVRRTRSRDRRSRVKNLVSLHTSTPADLSPVARLRFARRLLGTRRLGPDGKALLREVVARARRKKRVYVTFERVVEEPMR